MRALKAALDPQNIFNPGKIVPAACSVPAVRAPPTSRGTFAVFLRHHLRRDVSGVTAGRVP